MSMWEIISICIRAKLRELTYQSLIDCARADDAFGITSGSAVSMFSRTAIVSYHCDRSELCEMLDAGAQFVVRCQYAPIVKP